MLTHRMTIAEHDSTVTLMKKQYFSSPDGMEKTILRYHDWQAPQKKNFSGVPTAYEDDLKVWFRVIDKISNTGSTQYGLICQQVYRTLLERESFSPFDYVPGTKHPCLVYSDARQRWYRGIILSTKQPKYVVQDVDTGLIEETFLQFMSPQIMIDTPKCAHQGTLQNLKIFAPSDGIRIKLRDYFHREVLGKECLISWEVRVYRIFIIIFQSFSELSKFSGNEDHHTS